MTDIKTIEGHFGSLSGLDAVVVGRSNIVGKPLLKGALDTLRRHGVSDKQITIVRAPGAFEIPLVCKKIAAKGNGKYLDGSNTNEVIEQVTRVHQRHCDGEYGIRHPCVLWRTDSGYH